jgi:hypothetical protein
MKWTRSANKYSTLATRVINIRSVFKNRTHLFVVIYRRDHLHVWRVNA